MGQALGKAADTQPQASPFCVGVTWGDPSRYRMYVDGTTLVQLADGREGRLTGTGERDGQPIMYVQVAFGVDLIEVEYTIGEDERAIWPDEVVKVSQGSNTAAPTKIKT